MTPLAYTPPREGRIAFSLAVAVLLFIACHVVDCGQPAPESTPTVWRAAS